MALTYGSIMKRLVLMLALSATLGALPARAQNLAPAELEDRLRRAERDLEAVKETNDSLRKKLADLQRATDLVTEEAAKAATASNNALQSRAGKQELSQLRDALKESESRREADKKLFLEKFDELRRLMASAPPAPVFAPTPKAKERTEPAGNSHSSKAPAANVSDKGVYHTVEKNQTALEILKAYNDDLKSKGRTGKITLAQLQAANSGANLDRLRAGQKLFIPIPEK
jgi:vacuolar-type H+-ATPase subunit I/STV1